MGQAHELDVHHLGGDDADSAMHIGDREKAQTMLNLEEIRIDIGRSQKGSFVRVVHLPTSLERIEDPIGENSVIDVRNRLLRELEEELCRLEDDGLRE